MSNSAEHLFCGPKIAPGSLAQERLERERHDRTSYWTVVHYERQRVGFRYVVKEWDKTNPILGFRNAVQRMHCLDSGDGLWKVREVSQRELDNKCKKENGEYKFAE